MLETNDRSTEAAFTYEKIVYAFRKIISPIIPLPVISNVFHFFFKNSLLLFIFIYLLYFLFLLLFINLRY